MLNHTQLSHLQSLHTFLMTVKRYNLNIYLMNYYRDITFKAEIKLYHKVNGIF